MSLTIRAGEVTDTVTSPLWRPFRVVATVTDPVITVADPLHLDGPLAWCAYLAAQEAGVILPPIRPDRCVDFVLPLATWTRPAPDGVDPSAVGRDGLVWGWACSRAHYGDHGTTCAEIRKNPPTREYARYTTDRRHHDALGAHKARNQTLPAVHAPTITWWALGDPAAASDLLTRLRAVGRVTGHGNGRIISVTVQEGGPGDRDHWMDRDFPAVDGAPGSIRAPYWHATRRMPITPGPATWRTPC